MNDATEENATAPITPSPTGAGLLHGAGRPESAYEKARAEGIAAAERGEKYTQNPYARKTEESLGWTTGFNEVHWPTTPRQESLPKNQPTNENEH